MAHAIRSLFPKTGLRSFHVPRLIRALSCTRAMNQTDQSRNDITVPPPIPDKLQDLLFAFRESKALFVACELGIFDLLHDSKTPQLAENVAAKMKANADATTRLMDTLIALELLQKTKQGESWLYTNTKMASQFLTQSPGGGGGLPYENDGDARRKIRIKPPKGDQSGCGSGLI